MPWLSRVLNAHRPRTAVRAPAEDAEIPGHRDQGTGRAVSPHDRRYFFGGESLADAADVYLHAGFFQIYGLLGRIELDHVVVHILTGDGQLDVGRHPLGLRHPPEPDGRADGNVECAVGLRGDVERDRQQFEGLGAHLDRRVSGCPIHLRQFARIDPGAEHLLEPADLLEACCQCRLRRRFRRGDGRDVDNRAHEILGTRLRHGRGGRRDDGGF